MQANQMPNDTGWIQTHTGRIFKPLRPEARDVHPTDIAHGLSHMCRFNGHCTTFYSVAEHSLLVCKILAASEASPETQLWGLLHDASEAYIADITAPLKHQPEFKFYRDMESDVMAVICEYFGLPSEEPAAVKAADRLALCIEAYHLVSPEAYKNWNIAACPDEWKSADLGIPPVQARKEFLSHYNNLESLRA